VIVLVVSCVLVLVVMSAFMSVVVVLVFVLFVSHVGTPLLLRVLLVV
jgi:hypothetical protein